MAMIERVGWPAKRIYLHSDTVTQGFDGVIANDELLTLVYNNADAEQNFSQAMSVEGNFPKGDGTFTPIYNIFRTGWRIVPYDQVSHELKIITELLSVDGLRDRQLFDRSTVPATIFVDITPTYKDVEIREVDTGSGVPPEVALMITEIWQRQGLDRDNLLAMTDSLIQTGTIQLDIANPDANTTTVTRR